MRHATCFLARCVEERRVLCLETRRKPARTVQKGASVKHASSQRVFHYWNQRRGQRLAPYREDVEPGPIARALSDTFILAAEPGAEHRFRLAGTRVCALFSRELKGAAFLELWRAADRADMGELLAVVTNEVAGIVAGASGRTAEGAESELELLMLPMFHRGQGVRVLGVLAPLVTPYWIGTQPVVDLTLKALRHLGPAKQPAAADRREPAASGGRIRHGLMVYDGGRIS
jgi:hypothetical protein